MSRPHRLAIGWIWEVPFYKNARGFLGQALGNWQISGVYQAESGQPYDALSFNDANGNFDAAGDRAVLNAARGPGRGTEVNWVTRSGRIVDAATPVDPSEVVGYVAVGPERRVCLRGHGRSATPAATFFARRG